MRAKSDIRTESESIREGLRRQHGLRVVTAAEEGTAAEHLPNGVYGFTGSPAMAAPLFAERRFRNFEVHHLADGATVLVGFVTPVEAATIGNAETATSITVFPDAEQDSQTIVVIPHSRIASHRSVRDPNSSAVVLQVLSAAGIRA